MITTRKSGILLHPTSFPGPYGIGDIGSNAYKFVDFLYKAKQGLWQILPLGPTSFGDSPYQSFSTFACNTLLISLELLVKDGLLKFSDINVDDSSLQKNYVNYNAVYKYKNNIFKLAYENFKTTKEYDEFCESNAWLDNYALFIALKRYFINERKNGEKGEDYINYKKINKGYTSMSENVIDDCYFGAVWNSWPNDIASREKKAVERYTLLLKDEVNLEKFLQYQFYKQWCKLKHYANSKGIQIIGDIPIFVSADSCDVWENTHLYYLDENNNPTHIAGVPPDYFSEDGQLWGNPLYNWEEHKKENFKWWVERVRICLKMTDIIRIDHFRGFESYWAVKYGDTNAIKGTWQKGPGKELFEVIKKELTIDGKNIPIIAEDLGIITPKVEMLRDNLQLPGMKVLQFAFGDNNENAYLPHNYITQNCVVYTGTHDNDTIIGWYSVASEKEKDNFRRYMNTSGEASNWDMIRLSFSTVASYCITTLQDILSQGTYYRMNTPGTIHNNWQYRYEEELLNDNIAQTLAYLVKLYNR